jgi:hypothetical protein
MAGFVVALWAHTKFLAESGLMPNDKILNSHCKKMRANHVEDFSIGYQIGP